MRYQKKIFYLLFLFLLGLTHLSFSAIKIHETGLTYATIQDALDSASEGQHIYLSPGTYNGAGNRGIIWPNTNDLTLMANPDEGGNSQNVVLDAEKNTRHITIRDSVAIGLIDMKLINGTANYGGVINVSTMNVEIDISKCFFYRNEARYGGVIAALGDTYIKVAGSLFYDNKTKDAHPTSGPSSYGYYIGYPGKGGVFFQGNYQISESTFRQNTSLGVQTGGKTMQYIGLITIPVYSGGYGGVFYNSHATINQSFFLGNEAFLGGIFSSSEVSLFKSELKNNKATESPAFGPYNWHYGGSGSIAYSGTINFIDCIVSDNPAFFTDGEFSGGAFYSYNNSPILTISSIVAIVSGNTLVLNPTISDPDGDILNITYSGWMTSNVRQTSPADIGTHDVLITVDDGRGGVVTRSIHVVVMSNNDVIPINIGWNLFPVRKGGNRVRQIISSINVQNASSNNIKSVYYFDNESKIWFSFNGDTNTGDDPVVLGGESIFINCNSASLYNIREDISTMNMYRFTPGWNTFSAYRGLTYNVEELSSEINGSGGQLNRVYMLENGAWKYYNAENNTGDKFDLDWKKGYFMNFGNQFNWIPKK